MNVAQSLPKLGLGLLATVAVIASPTLIAQQVKAQQVVNVAPTGQEVSNNSTIAWQFDNISLVDGNTIKVFLNNQDVTSQSILDTSRNYFGYRPPQDLSPGTYEVRIEFKNKQGSGFVARWPFAVANARLEISSVTHNAADKPLGRNASFLATINGTPGANATVLLVQNGQTVRTLPTSQVSPGVYVATVTVGANDAVKEGILVGRLQAGNRVVYSVASQAFAFNPGTAVTQVTQTSTTTQPTTQTTVAPLSHAVTSHQDNRSINSAFTLMGTATPGATVVVNVKASAPSVGFLTIGSDETVLNNRMITIGTDGTFSINVPRATVIQQGTTYTVTMRATQGTEEKTMTLRLRQQ